jgi:hypothetical protein
MSRLKNLGKKIKKVATTCSAEGEKYMIKTSKVRELLNLGADGLISYIIQNESPEVIANALDIHKNYVLTMQEKLNPEDFIRVAMDSQTTIPLATIFKAYNMFDRNACEEIAFYSEDVSHLLGKVEDINSKDAHYIAVTANINGDNECYVTSFNFLDENKEVLEGFADLEVNGTDLEDEICQIYVPFNTLLDFFSGDTIVIPLT